MGSLDEENESRMYQIFLLPHTSFSRGFWIIFILSPQFSSPPFSLTSQTQQSYFSSRQTCFTGRPFLRLIQQHCYQYLASFERENRNGKTRDTFSPNVEKRKLDPKEALHQASRNSVDLFILFLERNSKLNIRHG